MTVLTNIAIIVMIVTVVYALNAVLTAIFSEDGIKSFEFDFAIRITAISFVLTCLLGIAIVAMRLSGDTWFV